MHNISNLKIDFVAPPLAGHLFPQLQLAKYAKSQGLRNLCFISCPKMQATVENAGIDFCPILADKEDELKEITDNPSQVMNSPRKMLTAVNKTLVLMEQFSRELRERWSKNKPDLVIVDFISPFAGVVADELGIPWWTAISSPSFLEVKHGTPTYLGGLMPPTTRWGMLRDALGRTLVRTFKNTAFFLYKNRLKNLGFPSLYREDGSERMFSRELILALGAKELEFDNAWSPLVTWLGPCPDSPVFDHQPPEFAAGKPHIFISLGTQIIWAKKRAKKVFTEVAHLLPDYNFHFALGFSELQEVVKEGNLHFYPYIPYTVDSFSKYQVIVNHGGIGVMYTAILAAAPQLVWAQDHDQHDCAARVVHRGLGLRTSGNPAKIAADIKTLIEEPAYQKRASEFQKIVARYHPGEIFLQKIRERFASP